MELYSKEILFMENLKELFSQPNIMVLVNSMFPSFPPCRHPFQPSASVQKNVPGASRNTSFAISWNSVDFWPLTSPKSSL